MKRHFLTGLKALAVGVMTLLAVSCYDDSKLWAGLDELKGRVDALEQKLNEQVETLNNAISALDAAYKKADADLLASLQAKDAELAASITSLTTKLDALDGKVDGLVTSSAADLKAAIDELKAADKLLADKDTEILASLTTLGVTKIEKNDAGNVVITFTGGSTIELPSNPNEGLVTVIDVDGVQYWAVIEDGEPKSIGVPVGHVALKFKVDASTNRLQYSVDNGKTWTNTGAYVANSMYSLLTDMYIDGYMDESTYEWVDNDYVTVVFGGEEYYLPVYKADNSVVTIKSGKTYFSYGESKTFEVDLKDIKDCYVMTKPDGWKVKLNGKELTVTAPSEANVTSGVAEAEGDVLLHGNTADGKCKVAKLSVSTASAEFTMTVTEDGKITYKTSSVVTKVKTWPIETEVTEFMTIATGLAPISTFGADPVGYVSSTFAAFNEYGTDEIFTFVSNLQGYMEYGTDSYYDDELEDFVDIDPVTELDFTITVENFYKEVCWNGEWQRGSHFVVWAAPVNEDNTVNTDELVYYYYTPMESEFEPAEDGILFNDITVEASLFGAQSWVMGMVEKEMTYSYWDEDYNLEGALQNWMYFQKGYASAEEALMGISLENGEHEINLSDVQGFGYQSVPLKPNTTYYVYVMPIIEGKANADYVFANDVIVKEFTTAPVTKSVESTASVELTAESTFSEINATVELDGVSMAFYNWYDVEEANAEEEELIEDLMATGTVITETSVVRNQYLKPGESYTLVVLAIDENGLYSGLEMETFSTKKVPYETSASIKVTSVDATTPGSTSISFEVTGDVTKVVCNARYWADSDEKATFESEVLQYGVNAIYVYHKYADIVDGKATVTGINCGNNKNVYYTAYKTDGTSVTGLIEGQYVNVDTWTPAE